MWGLCSGRSGGTHRAFQTAVGVKRGLLVGLSRKKWEFTTYNFNPGIASPTVVLEAGVNF